MSAKQFFKSTTFKCLVTLLCILLVSGIFLTISYGFLEVTEGERLQRAISKIYSGQEVEIYGKDGKLITKQDKNPESLIGETVTVDNAEISQMYKIVTGGETDYLVQSLGKGGYGGGSVTCWVALNVSETKINSVRKVSVATNKGQSFIGKITGGFLESFTNGYFDGVYYSTDEGYLSSGATMSSNAICNSVNGAITYVNENIFKNVEINKFENFDLLSYTDSQGDKIASVNTRLSDFKVNGDAVEYTLVTCSEARTNPFKINITVGSDKKISSYEIITNGSTESSKTAYIDKMPESIKDGSMFTGKGIDYFKAHIGDSPAYSNADGSLKTGATQSNTVCFLAGAFATANYDNCIAYSLKESR